MNRGTFIEFCGLRVRVRVRKGCGCPPTLTKILGGSIPDKMTPRISFLNFVFKYAA